MVLPKPTHQFKIPSLYDGGLLQCRIYHGDCWRDLDMKPTCRIKGAMIAHPYAPLGGCYDDPVVAVVGSEFLRAGYIVGTFNLRGAGDSQGRTSWTAKPEFGDFISFYFFLAHYILGLDANLSQTSTVPENDVASIDGRHGPSIIVSGYSYGSMLARYSPPSRSILSAFQRPKENDPAFRILQQARSLSLKWNIGAGMHNTYSTSDQSTSVISNTKITGINISYLLISPILPPASTFTAMSLLTPASKLTITINGDCLPTSDLQDKVLGHRTLVIFGEKDGFTSSKKLLAWCEDLKKVEGSQLDSIMVKGAGHFWHEDKVESQMRRAIQEWIAMGDIYRNV
ncbi:hypothetical protein MGYG_08417 [Nannizzia gypsea CBS 118893]|uniref:AB hydrolase-1 domain-containing protein n=1 Tax=Arthroderma gypseum (strain ATCC MYA-4604 / CBS 118893) TaxID=535722 RepID=E4V5N0_ARTGP|nr:hypothetical protein MGYG_08417 [Nannizzia gypsea CBS 118893]EFR05405.1 hypothetical protein MGYG_08417 [Nannizzia gypsea CBS 118893]